MPKLSNYIKVSFFLLLCGCKVTAQPEVLSVTNSGDCDFNGLTVANGKSVPGFQSPTVPFGSACVSQTRTCSNGILSGTYQNRECEPLEESTQSCVFNGSPVAHGATVTAYQNANVPSGATCVSQPRTCNNGTLSGSYTIAACYVDCKLGNTPVSHGQSITGYKDAAPTYPAVCEAETRVCNNGVLNGTFANIGCDAFVVTSCDGVANGETQTRSFYKAAKASFADCRTETQTRTCNNGTWGNWVRPSLLSWEQFEYYTIPNCTSPQIQDLAEVSMPREVYALNDSDSLLLTKDKKLLATGVGQIGAATSVLRVLEAENDLSSLKVINPASTLAPPTGHRAQLREVVDTIIMAVKDFDFANFYKINPSLAVDTTASLKLENPVLTSSDGQPYKTILGELEVFGYQTLTLKKKNTNAFGPYDFCFQNWDVSPPVSGCLNTSLNVTLKKFAYSATGASGMAVKVGNALYYVGEYRSGTGRFESIFRLNLPVTSDAVPVDISPSSAFGSLSIKGSLRVNLGTVEVPQYVNHLILRNPNNLANSIFLMNIQTGATANPIVDLPLNGNNFFTLNGENYFIGNRTQSIAGIYKLVGSSLGVVNAVLVQPLNYGLSIGKIIKAGDHIVFAATPANDLNSPSLYTLRISAFSPTDTALTNVRVVVPASSGLRYLSNLTYIPEAAKVVFTATPDMSRTRLYRWTLPD